MTNEVQCKMDAEAASGRIMERLSVIAMELAIRKRVNGSRRRNENNRTGRSSKDATTDILTFAIASMKSLRILVVNSAIKKAA